MGSTVRRLAGRDEEALATAGLAEAVAAAAGHVLVVDGGPGTGRSALAALAVEQARARGLDAVLVRAGGGTPEPLGVAAGLLGARACGTASEAAHDLLAAAGAGRVLVVDDAHWADAPSLEALVRVARNLDGRRLGLLLTATPDVRDPAVGALLDELRALPDSVLLRLGALDLEAFGPLVGPEADAEAVRALHVRTAGLPGLAAALSGCAPDAPVPGRIRAQVAARLSGLGADPTAVARAVAVLGGEVPLRLVQATSGLDRSTMLTATNTLVRAGMCTVAGGVRMTAPVLGEAVVAGLDASAVDMWHRRAAAVLHDDGAPARDVGALLLAALPAGDDWTVERLLDAAAAAADAGAGTETVALLRRALAEPPPRDRLTTVLMDLASAESRMADPRALERTEAALEVAAEPADRVSLRRFRRA